MKKAFCFSLIVIYLALAGLTPVKADDVSVGGYYDDSDTLSSSQLSTLENTSLLLEYLRQGGTIDVKNTDSSYDSYSLIDDFGNFVRDVINVGADIINPFQTEVQYHGIQPIRYADPYIFQFMGLLPFYALQEPDVPVPNPDPDYNYYIDLINGSGFNFIRNKTNTGPYYGKYIWEIYPPELSSYFKKQHNNGGTSNVAWISAPITTVNIIGEGDNYSLLYTFNTQNTWNLISGPNNITPTNNALLWNDNSVSVYDPVQPWTATVEGTLEQVFADLSRNARNINIYVNGVPWSIISSPTTTYNIEISIGTVTTENNGKVRWEYDTYIYYDIDLIEQELSLLLDEIRNLNHPSIIRFDDFEDLIVDVNGSPALAVKVVNNELSLDDRYYEDYGPIIPLFVPMFTPVINDSDIVNITEVSTSPLPDELMEVCGYIFVGTLFACFIHRLLE